MSKELTREQVEKSLDKIAEVYEWKHVITYLRDHDALQRATIQQLKARVAKLDALLIHDYIPRSDFVREQELRARADSNLSEKLLEIDGLDENIEQLEKRLAESEKAAYDVDETIQRQKQTIEQFEARVKELEAIAPPCR